MFACFCLGLSKESFFFQMDAIFDGVYTRKNSSTNGKIIKTRQSCDEKHPLFHKTVNSLTSFEPENTNLSHDDQVTDFLPPAIPPRTPITDESCQLQQKKPVPPPRKLERSKPVSSIDVYKTESERDSESPERDKPARFYRHRVSSRVDCLYALAPPPGSPHKTENSPGGFVFQANINWSLNSSSESDVDETEDFEYFTLPLNSETPKIKSTDSLSSSAIQISKPFLSHIPNDNVSDTHESIEPLYSSEDKLIKKSSPIITKRPVWFKRDSVCSSRISLDMKVPRHKKTVKRRSRSLDATMQRKIVTPMDQFRDQPVALSDSEDTTGGSESYTKPFDHVRIRKRYLSNRQTTGSRETLESVFASSDNWHCYDYDSDNEEDMYYINPEEVASNFTPKQSTVDSVGLPDNTYLMLSKPELEKIYGSRSAPQRKIGVTAHSPSPIPIPSPRMLDSAGSRETSDGSGSESIEYEGTNIYEHLDNETMSPVIKSNNVLKRHISTDDTYARIDEVRNNLTPIPTHIANSSNYPSVQSLTEQQMFNSNDMLKEDGYACVGMGSRVQAPSLPPRPPTFTRVRPSNQVRTVPGVRISVFFVLHSHI